MTAARTLLVSAPRGSGGSYAHLSRVIPRLLRLLSSWRIEVWASADALRACFGGTGEPWMRPLPEGGYRARLRWEFVDLPRRLRADANALLWSPFGPPLNLRLAPRAVWMSRNLLPLLSWRELELGAADRARILALRRLFSLWARRARRTICVSSHARERLARLAGVDTAAIDVVPHGVDPLADTLRCSDGHLERIRASPYVLNVGQPIAYRRTRELIGAFAILARRRPDAPPLVVAGGARSVDKAYEGACLQALAPLQHGGRAHVLGQISHADSLALISSANTFVYPSVHEDCPNVVLEALSARRVSVYADIPAVRELAADAGIFVRDPQPEPIAEALERALFEAPERARVAREGAGRAALFTWDRTAERTAAILENAAEAASTAWSARVM
jgi:glycosyltransferase involved in cell wall biosynthesis